MATILIIDDSESVLASLECTLRGESHEVLTASSGTEALKIIQHHSLDLVITDIYMPPPDGLEVMRELRAMKSNMPVIAISSRPTPTNMFMAARGLGAKISLQKPFPPETLIEAVNAVLDNGIGPVHYQESQT